MTTRSTGRLPAVDVVIPCYNYGHYLPECVRSVVEQEGADLRVLIIDNASTDDSPRVAEALAASDARVELRARSVRQGHIETYNEGLEWATRTYTVLISADDALAPGSLRRACGLLDAHPRVGFVYGRCAVMRDGRPRPAPKSGAGKWIVHSGQRWLAERCYQAVNCIRSPEVVARTSLLQRLGGYRIELPHTADFELWMRLAAYADVGYVRGPHHAFYRDHAGSLHHQRFGTALRDLSQIGAAFEVLFRDHGGDIADRARLESLARRMLAKRALLAACNAYDRGLEPIADVDGLEELAAASAPDAADLPEMRGLRRRRRLGPRASRLLWPLLPPSILSRLARRARRDILRRFGL
jgi:glycosyltransferase involved in cell wall biosynthesis